MLEALISLRNNSPSVAFPLNFCDLKCPSQAGKPGSRLRKGRGGAGQSGEAGFLQARRAAVTAAVVARGGDSSALVKRAVKRAADQLWSDSHDAEISFNQGKQKKRCQGLCASFLCMMLGHCRMCFTLHEASLSLVHDQACRCAS